MLSCRIFGHDTAFTAEGRTMSWSCERCGEQLGSKDYPDEESAQRYARGLGKRDSDDLGRRAPFLGMLPLRIWRRMKERIESRG